MANLDEIILGIVEDEHLSSEEKCEQLNQLFALSRDLKDCPEYKFLKSVDTHFSVERELFYTGDLKKRVNIPTAFLLAHFNDSLDITFPVFELLVKNGYSIDMPFHFLMQVYRDDKSYVELVSDLLLFLNPDLSYCYSDKSKSSMVYAQEHPHIARVVKAHVDLLKIFNPPPPAKDQKETKSVAQLSPSTAMAHLTSACANDCFYVTKFLTNKVQNQEDKGLKSTSSLLSYTKRLIQLVASPSELNAECCAEIAQSLLPAWSNRPEYADVLACFIVACAGQSDFITNYIDTCVAKEKPDLLANLIKKIGELVKFEKSECVSQCKALIEILEYHKADKISASDLKHGLGGASLVGQSVFQKINAGKAAVEAEASQSAAKSMSLDC